MSTFRSITLSSNDGSETVRGDLVVETSQHWQVAVRGQVRAFTKTDYRETTATPGAPFDFNSFIQGLR